MIRLLLAAGAALALVGGCAPEMPRDAAAVEALGMRAAQTGERDALGTLRAWATRAPAALAPVAARELGLALAAAPGHESEASRWLQRGAEVGDAEAAFVVGEAHRRGGLGWRPDAAAARPWFERAAQAGHADAALALARAAANGDGQPRDPALALQWLLNASSKGSVQAMYLLSHAYTRGEGTAVDTAAARHWLEEAAEKHLPAAMQDWALALEDGRLGVTRDAQAAHEEWREAREERRNRWNLR